MKGFRNQIKNLWWRKGKEDAPDNQNGPMYTFSSIESQIRVLGDYAFMLQDYELALSNYRFICTDYKLDKAWRHFAGVQEMMGLAYFMLDQSRKDADYCMETAFSTYSKIASSGMRNATRCGLWWAEMLKARGQYKDAAVVYFRICGEEPLHSAVMLEQASYCYLLSTPTMLRKYGFHLVLSGDLYMKCKQIKHAIRTYRGALSVFKGTAWTHIGDRVHFHIGKWYAFLGIFDEAIRHMLEVLASGHQSRATQELFLRDFFQVIQVQLKVTPKIEGTLKVVGVRWKLSGSVVGVCNFNSDVIRKKVAKGKRKPKQSMKDSLKFLVIKSLPRLEGVVHNLPKTVYAGDFRRLTLEMRNPSKISVKNLKMRVNHPRFVNIADQEIMNLEFPTCLEKQANSSQSCAQVDTAEETNSAFVFPETTTISWDTPFMWPLWFRAAVAGNISLYITIYYEMEDKSTVIIYRTLRMHYNLEVLPSLEVSFQLIPCPSRLQEFLVRMDVINRTSSQSFQVHQLSCVGYQGELTLLQSTDSVFPLEFLLAGQALSFFFKLKKGRTRGTVEDKISSLFMSGRADVRLGASDSRGFFDTSISPLNLFHHHERIHKKRLDQEHQNTVDFILISESRSDNDPRLSRTTNIFSHHTCHCKIVSTSPISWLMNGPQIVRHDFTVTICEINLSLTVYNTSEHVASIRIKTLDSTSAVNSISNAASVSGNEVGWHDLSHLSDIKVTSDVTGTRVGKAPTPESVSPFIWSGSSSTGFKLEPLSCAGIPLQICVFSPGTFDLSNYSLHWNHISTSTRGDDENESRVSSGTCQGHSYHITVLQKE